MTAIEAAEYAHVKFGFLMQAAYRKEIGIKNLSTGEWTFTQVELDTWIANLPNNKGKV